MGPLGDDLVLVAKGRFQAFVDDARLFGRDWGLRLADVKASVLADQRSSRAVLGTGWIDATPSAAGTSSRE